MPYAIPLYSFTIISFWACRAWVFHFRLSTLALFIREAPANSGTLTMPMRVYSIGDPPKPNMWSYFTPNWGFRAARSVSIFSLATSICRSMAFRSLRLP